MQQLTPSGQQIVNDLSQRYGFSTDAVTHMLFAVLNGNGSMAQFNHPEFAGSGQWMAGGMIMLGDLFNHGLKSSVDSLCNEIATLLINQPGLLRTGSYQSQSQGGNGNQSQASGAPQGNNPFVVQDAQNWYPAELGIPNSTGSQNTTRYAYFANARRLAVDTGGDVWVYDTLDHQIGGFSQQQGGGGAITFSSQYGTLNLTSLPVVYRHGQKVTDQSTNTSPPVQPTVQNQGSPGDAEIFETIKRLGELKDQGILTHEEFQAKKTELLARL